MANENISLENLSKMANALMFAIGKSEQAQKDFEKKIDKLTDSSKLDQTLSELSSDLERNFDNLGDTIEELSKIANTDKKTDESKNTLEKILKLKDTADEHLSIQRETLSQIRDQRDDIKRSLKDIDDKLSHTTEYLKTLQDRIKISPFFDPNTGKLITNYYNAARKSISKQLIANDDFLGRTIKLISSAKQGFGKDENGIRGGIKGMFKGIGASIGADIHTSLLNSSSTIANLLGAGISAIRVKGASKREETRQSDIDKNADEKLERIRTKSSEELKNLDEIISNIQKRLELLNDTELKDLSDKDIEKKIIQLENNNKSIRLFGGNKQYIENNEANIQRYNDILIARKSEFEDRRLLSGYQEQRDKKRSQFEKEETIVQTESENEKNKSRIQHAQEVTNAVYGGMRNEDTSITLSRGVRPTYDVTGGAVDSFEEMAELGSKEKREEWLQTQSIYKKSIEELDKLYENQSKIVEKASSEVRNLNSAYADQLTFLQSIVKNITNAYRKADDNERIKFESQSTVSGLSSLTALAEGGVVTKPTKAIVGEGGEPEAIVPLSKAGNIFGGNQTSADFEAQQKRDEDTSVLRDKVETIVEYLLEERDEKNKEKSKKKKGGILDSLFKFLGGKFSSLIGSISGLAGGIASALLPLLSRAGSLLTTKTLLPLLSKVGSSLTKGLGFLMRTAIGKFTLGVTAILGASQLINFGFKKFANTLGITNKQLDEGAEAAEKFTGTDYNATMDGTSIGDADALKDDTGVDLDKFKEEAGFGSLFKKIGSGISGMFSSIPDVDEENYEPHAEGGIVTEEHRAIVGEKGPEAILPLDDFYKREDRKEINAIVREQEESAKMDERFNPLQEMAKKAMEFFEDTSKIMDTLKDGVTALVGDKFFGGGGGGSGLPAQKGGGGSGYDTSYGTKSADKGMYGEGAYSPSTQTSTGGGINPISGKSVLMDPSKIDRNAAWTFAGKGGNSGGKVAQDVKDAIMDAAIQNGLDPSFMASLSNSESGLRAGAINKEGVGGATGLFQVMPSNIPGLIKAGVLKPGEDLRDPRVNARVGAWMIKDNIRQLGRAGNEASYENVYGAMHLGAGTVNALRRIQKQNPQLNAIQALEEYHKELVAKGSKGAKAIGATIRHANERNTSNYNLFHNADGSVKSIDQYFSRMAQGLSTNGVQVGEGQQNTIQQVPNPSSSTAIPPQNLNQEPSSSAGASTVPSTVSSASGGGNALYNMAKSFVGVRYGMEQGKARSVYNQQAYTRFNQLKKDANGNWVAGSKSGVFGGAGTMDCSQFVSTVMTNLGYGNYVNKAGGAHSAEMIRQDLRRKGFKPKASINQLQEGDVLFTFGSAHAGAGAAGHVAVAVRNPETGQLEIAESVGGKSYSGVQIRPISGRWRGSNVEIYGSPANSIQQEPNANGNAAGAIQDTAGGGESGSMQSQLADTSATQNPMTSGGQIQDTAQAGMNAQASAYYSSSSGATGNVNVTNVGGASSSSDKSGPLMTTPIDPMGWAVLQGTTVH